MSPSREDRIIFWNEQLPLLGTSWTTMLKAEDVTQWVVCLPGITKPWVPYLAPQKPNLAGSLCNPCSPELQAGGIHGEFKVIMRSRSVWAGQSLYGGEGC